MLFVIDLIIKNNEYLKKLANVLVNIYIFAI